MRTINRVAAATLASFLLLGCSSRLSNANAGALIKSAWDAKFSALKPDCEVTVLGISTEGNTAVVKAEVKSNGPLAGMLRPEVHNFFFRKYDSGWAIESFQ